MPARPKRNRLRHWALLLPMAFVAALALLMAAAPSPPKAEAKFKAGAYSVDVSPLKFPVLVNGGFTERMANKVVDPLFAKALAFDDGSTRLVICVVDTCMMPRELIDAAKAIASKTTGIPTNRMLVSATHTHSAPSVMGCLGSRVDPEYAAWLPGKIAEAISGAVERLQPARVGWTSYDDWDHTFNRRWIRRADRVLTDPFGNPTVRANMHPGYQSPDAIGPSGPVDPRLSILAVQTMDGKPLALLANYSQHYYGSDAVSSDYFGKFAGEIAKRLGAGPDFVGIMSQGTSGDLASMDYSGAARKPGDYQSYAAEIAVRVAAAHGKIQWRGEAPLGMAERKLTLNFRTPNAERLAWAKEMVAKMGKRIPQNQPEVYAWEAIYLQQRPKAELVLQAARVGDLGITAIPNEVYCLTGLKLNVQSPFSATFNMSLANGSEGYIPPPEQHKLGGYTTWPARTAGLEPAAEPRIVETVLGLLEEVAGKPRRVVAPDHGQYAQAVLADQPAVYWRLDEMVAPLAQDASGHRRDGLMEDGIALYLPGVGSGKGVAPDPALTASKFTSAGINRSIHFAGGRLRAEIPAGLDHTVEFWFWNGLPADARPVTAYLYSRGRDEDPLARGEHLGIGGTFRADLTGRLLLFNGNERNDILAGKTVLSVREWHHVALVREGKRVRVHLNGNAEPEIAGEFAATIPPGCNTVFFGGRNDRLFGLEGKMDEVAIYPRALNAGQIAAHHQTSGIVAAANPLAGSGPLSAEESLKKIHVRPGYKVELAAAEPLTMDPVAIDWDEKGRMWVVEMADYPMGMDGKGKPGGRVRVLEDTDGDGRYDKAALFADGLNFPTGLLTWRDGVIVTAAPEVLFLRDTNNDGVADQREVLISGLLQGNQQLRANGLRWGLDNWVYCAAGGHHGEYGAGTKFHSHRLKADVLIGGRDFRFRPDTGELEAESGPSQFGRNRDDWGHWFGTQNSRPLWHYVLAERHLRRNPHVPAPDATRQIVGPVNPPVWPVSAEGKRYHSFNHAGHYTSACGGMIYQDSLLFPDGGMHAFTCEPVHNLVQHNVLVDDGVSYVAKRAPGEEAAEFFASEDQWCRPVMTRTGPDGALWVVDIYRCMIEHPEWLPAEGRTETLPQYRLGDDKGRIYRVSRSDAPARSVARALAWNNNEKLVKLLQSPNGWLSDKAHQLLLWRKDTDALPLLGALARDATTPLGRLHALCVLDGMNALTPELVEKALSDPHPGVRENALRLAEPRGTPAVIAAAVKLTGDPSAKVRMQLACTLGEWKDMAAGEALGRLAIQDAGDPHALAAILSSAPAHLRTLARTLRNEKDSGTSKLVEPICAMALATKDRESLALALAAGVDAHEGRYSAAQMQSAARMLAAIAQGGGSLDALASVADDSLAQKIRKLPALFESARGVFESESTPLGDQVAAASLLTGAPDRKKETLKRLAGWLEPQRSSETQLAAVKLLAASADESVAAMLLEAWASFAPEARAAALEALLTREPWTLALLGLMERAQPPLLLDASQRTQVLKHPSAKVRERAAKILKPNAARAKALEDFKPALKMAGDAKHGRAVFERLCIACHKLGEAGRDVGPNLRSVVEHTPEKLFTNILDPSADVQPGYHAYLCQLKDGSQLYGMLTLESSHSITLKLPDGSTRAAMRRDIAKLQSINMSLMPDGLEAGMTVSEMADLIQFLRTP